MSAITHSLLRNRVVPLAIAGVLLTACGDNAGSLTDARGGATALSVSFTAASADSTAPAGRPLVIAVGADTMIISRVQMVVDEFEMEREGSSSCPDSMRVSDDDGRSSDDGDCSRLDRGPILFELPLGSATRQALSVTVPAGRYDEFELEIDDVDGDAGDSAAERAFIAANPAFRNVSVRVEGTYRGAPFVFTSRPDVELEFEFEPSLVIEGGVNDNVTIDVDLARWFTDASGRLVAPTAVNRSLIDGNIVSSISLFGDRNRDGREDDGRSRSNRRGSDD